LIHGAQIRSSSIRIDLNRSNSRAFAFQSRNKLGIRRAIQLHPDTAALKISSAQRFDHAFGCRVLRYYIHTHAELPKRYDGFGSADNDGQVPKRFEKIIFNSEGFRFGNQESRAYACEEYRRVEASRGDLAHEVFEFLAILDRFFFQQWTSKN